MWRRADEFRDSQEAISGGSSPVLRLVEEINTTGSTLDSPPRVFVAKCSLRALGGAAARQDVAREWADAGPFEEEYREAFALLIYREAFAVRAPVVHLAMLPVQTRHDLSGLVEFGGVDLSVPKLHILTGYERGFTPFGPDFIAAYRAHVRRNREERYRLPTPSPAATGAGEGATLPLIGFGALLAAASLLDDRDVLGASGTNAGYVFVDAPPHPEAAVPERDHESSNGPHFTVFKLDAGCAFQYRYGSGVPGSSGARGTVLDQRRSILFAELCKPDQAEFIETLKRALVDLRPFSTHRDVELSLLRRLQAEVEPDDDSASAAYPLAYMPHLADGLQARVSQLVTQYAHALDQFIVREWETEIARLTVSALTQDSEPEQTVEAVETLTARLAQLRGRVVHQPVEADAHGRQVRTFQLPAVRSFVGRTNELNTLHKNLHQQGATVITSQGVVGMGGVGKTTLAAQYATLAATGGLSGDSATRCSYGSVVWLRAEHSTELDAQFLALASQWCNFKPERDDDQSSAKDAARAREEVWKVLQCGVEAALVIFDNLPSLDKLAMLLPATTGDCAIHFLVTTRDVRPCSGVSTLNIETFDLECVIAFVAARFSDGEVSKDRRLMERLHRVVDGLPLALVQLDGYMRTTGLGLEETIDCYDANLSDLLFHGMLDGDSHPRTIGTLVTLAMVRLEAQASDAVALLTCAAFMDPDCFDATFLAIAAGCSSDSCQRAIEVLLLMGLISPTAPRGAFSMHRLVGYCVRQYMEAVGSSEHVQIRMSESIGRAADNGLLDGMTSSVEYVFESFRTTKCVAAGLNTAGSFVAVAIADPGQYHIHVFTVVDETSSYILELKLGQTGGNLDIPLTAIEKSFDRLVFLAVVGKLCVCSVFLGRYNESRARDVQRLLAVAERECATNLRELCSVLLILARRLASRDEMCVLKRVVQMARTTNGAAGTAELRAATKIGALAMDTPRFNRQHLSEDIGVAVQYLTVATEKCARNYRDDTTRFREILSEAFRHLWLLMLALGDLDMAVNNFTRYLSALPEPLKEWSWDFYPLFFVTPELTRDFLASAIPLLKSTGGGTQVISDIRGHLASIHHRLGESSMAFSLLCEDLELTLGRLAHGGTYFSVQDSQKLNLLCELCTLHEVCPADKGESILRRILEGAGEMVTSIETRRAGFAALGKLYLREGRLPESRDCLENAFTAAEQEVVRIPLHDYLRRILLDLAQCHHLLGDAVNSESVMQRLRTLKDL